jgi:hypothetical protein
MPPLWKPRTWVAAKSRRPGNRHSLSSTASPVLIDEMSTGLAAVVVESLIPLVRQAADESGPSGDLVTAGPAAELGRDAAALQAAYPSGGEEPPPR